MAERFTNINQMNPTQKALRDNPPTVPRSKFNLSRVVEQNMELGRIHVLDVIETIPGDTFTALNYIISLQSRNPTVKRAQTGMRMYVHAHYMRWSDIWEGAQNYIDCGNTGKINKQMPTLVCWLPSSDYPSGPNPTINLATPGSLIDEIGAPATAFDRQRSRLTAGFGAIQTPENYINGNRFYNANVINALPFAMYQMICLERYFDRNLIQRNKHWVPENQHHWILPYNAEHCRVLNYENPNPDINTTDFRSGNALEGTGNRQHVNPNGRLVIPQDENTPVLLAMPRYALKKGDYFTTSLPFSMLLRGDIPTVNIAQAISTIDWSNAVINVNERKIDRVIGLDTTTKKLAVSIGLDTAQVGQDNAMTANGEMWDTNPYSRNGIWFETNQSNQNDLVQALNKAKINTIVNASIDMATLNALEAMTIYRQRMALTDGKYNSMIEAQFGYSPEAPNNAPMYIGGFYMDLIGSDVVQTSESNTSPLGTKAGRIDSINSGNIGTFHAKDYGYIMVTAYICPDTYYNSGLERQVTRKRQDEVYFPIFNNLAPQAILNQELFYSDNENIDFDIFAWTERYSDYKSRTNRVRGLMAVDELDDSTYTMQQWINTTPTLSNKFMSLSQENIDMGVFSSPEEPPFIATIGQNVEVVRAMPYVTMPAGLRGGTQ